MDAHSLQFITITIEDSALEIMVSEYGITWLNSFLGIFQNSKYVEITNPEIINASEIRDDVSKWIRINN